MPRVRLLHWKAEEAEAHLKTLRAAGWQTDYDERFRPELMRQWRDSPPDAFVIDLSRLPSHGREIAIALRQSPRTRCVPIVFCDGEEEKVARTARDLPDAVYCQLRTLRSSLRKALANRPVNPVKPTEMMARYAGRTAAQKLGIREGSQSRVVDPPRDFRKVIGALPAGVEFLEESAENAPVTLCFVHEAHSMLETLSRVRKLASRTKLWILWRKGGSAARGEVTENLVREHALDLGLVDYKICSVNEVWSALAFAAANTRRRA